MRALKALEGLNMKGDGFLPMVGYGLATLLCGVLAWTYSILFGEVHLHHVILIPFSFIALGVLIKFGDESYDSNCFSRKISNILSVPCGMWMGGLIYFDPDSATIFIGLLLALLVAAKYDNTAFKLGFGIAFGVAAISLIVDPGNISYLGILLVFVAAFVDELINDRMDVARSRGPIRMFMRERPVLKFVILGLCVTSVLSSYLYFFAFMGFDMGYSFVDRYAVWRGCQSAKA